MGAEELNAGNADAADADAADADAASPAAQDPDAVNTVLADIIDRGAAADEADALLAALVDVGVYVPVNEDHAVVFMKGADDSPVLPGYASAQACRSALPQAVPVHCDGPRLLDIGARTGVQRLLAATEKQWALVPMPLVMRVLNDRGMRTAGERQIRLTRSVEPAAIALRDALARRILDFPGVTAVWIADVLWADSGVQQLMLHVAVDATADPQVRGTLMNALLREEVELGANDPQISVRILDPVAEAPFIAELDRMGLDTVRADHVAGRVEVVSVDYDEDDLDRSGQ